MEKQTSSFPRKHTLFAVIHVEDQEQAYRNAMIAHDEGAYGIFLVNHGISSRDLFRIGYRPIRNALPNFPIGLNCRGLSAEEDAMDMIPIDATALWVDDAGITESEDPVARAWQMQLWRSRVQSRMWRGIYFGGVASEGLAPVKDYGYVARLAVPFMDVVTTTISEGSLTDNIEKIRLMKEAIGVNHPLAIAGNISPDNVRSFTPYADCILASRLDLAEVRELAKLLS